MIQNVVQKVMSDAMQPDYFKILLFKTFWLVSIVSFAKMLHYQLSLWEHVVKVFLDASHVLIHGFKAITIAQSAERKMGQVKHLF